MVFATGANGRTVNSMADNELFGNSEQLDDTISRAAVLDEIHKYMEERDYTIGTLYDNICEMPSAQPETIRCKDCKHWTNNIGDSKLRDNYCNEAVHGFYYRCSGDDYCSFAERRTDG